MPHQDSPSIPDSGAISGLDEVRKPFPIPKLSVIDLDGTLVDTVPDLASCCDHMLSALGLQRAGEAQVRNWVGNGLDSLIQSALAAQLDSNLDPELLERAREIFLELYARHTSDASAVEPGARAGLSFLRSSGSLLACVTNKAHQFTQRLLDDLGLFSEFSIIVSGDTLSTKKPDPAPLLYAAERLEVHSRDCLLIGDSATDVQAARAANFRIICVSYGYNRGLDIRQSHPDAVIDSLAELETLFEQVT